MSTTLETERREIHAEAAIPPNKFAHFVVATSQPEIMIDWYKTVLHAEEVFRNDFICFLTYDDEHHRLAVVAAPGLQAAPPRTRGVAHLAYSYRNLGELLANYVRLKALGIRPYWPINHGPTLSMYYKDPDSTAIEFQVDLLKTKEELRAYFAGDEFRRKPVGVIFDPDQLVRDYEAGVPEEVLTKRPPLPDGVAPTDMIRM